MTTTTDIVTTPTTWTYMNREIEATYEEDGKAKVEVTASIGEFAGTLLGITAGGEYLMVELDFTQAHKLMLALQDALNIHANAASE